MSEDRLTNQVFHVRQNLLQSIAPEIGGHYLEVFRLQRPPG